MLERLERIEALDRAAAAPAELRALVREAEEWVRAEGGDRDAERAAARLRLSLARDMIAV